MEEARFGPVTFIPGLRNGRYPYCHSLYLEADCKVVIDPASNRERLVELMNGPGVDAVWLTHYHEDHFMHLDLFRNQEFWISELDAPPMAELDCLLDYYGMTHDGEREFWAPLLVEQFNYRPRKADRFFREEETIDLGGVTVEVIPTPGHTAGHCSFFFPEPGVLFLGDYDLTSFGPWYGDVYSDIDATIASVERLRRIPARVWVAAHLDGIFETDPGETWDRYLRSIDEREEKLLDLLKEPRTLDEIIQAKILYGRWREPLDFFIMGERGNMLKHLERLRDRGAVLVENGLYRLA